MQLEKNPRKTYDTGLHKKVGTKNIQMRFQNGIKIDQSTKTPCWDKAQLVITNKVSVHSKPFFLN